MATKHIPAWKRLGLKLKYAKEEPDSPARSSVNGTSNHLNGRTTHDEPPRKKIRFDDSDHEISKSAQPKDLKKKVSFTSDTKDVDGDTARPAIPTSKDAITNGKSVTKDTSTATNGNPANPKSKSKAPKHTQPSPSKKSEGLSYLDSYFHDHKNWKFNKNRETWVLSNVFATSVIPKEYNFKVACYVSGLKSKLARERLGYILAELRDIDSDVDDEDAGQMHEKEEKFRRMHELIGQFLERGVDLNDESTVKWTNKQRRDAVLEQVLNGTQLRKTPVVAGGKETHHTIDNARENEASKTALPAKVVTSKPTSKLLPDTATDPHSRRQRKSKLRSNLDISSSESSSSSEEDNSSESSSDDSSEAESSSSEGSKSESDGDSD